MCKKLDLGNTLSDHVRNNNSLSATMEWVNASFVESSQGFTSPPRYPPIEAARELFEQYYLSIETFTPIVGRSTGESDLLALYASSDEQIHPGRIREVFRAQMILAISMHVLADAQPTLGTRNMALEYAKASNAIYLEASSRVRDALVKPSRHSISTTASQNELEQEETLEKLQIVLLQVVYLILSPSHGNVWQILGFADRLWRSIARKGTYEAHLRAGESSRYSMLAGSFLFFERLVSTALGRPTEPLDYDTSVNEARDIPALLVRILGIKAHLHASYQATRIETATADASPGGSKQPADINPRVLAWLNVYEQAVERVVGLEDHHLTIIRPWLLSYGRSLADETRLLALCLHWQETNTDQTPSPLEKLKDADIQEGSELVSSLLRHYKVLSGPTRVHMATVGWLQLILPFSWIWAQDIFRVAIAAAFIDHSSANPTLQSEIQVAVQLLRRYHIEDVSCLATAICAIAPG